MSFFASTLRRWRLWRQRKQIDWAELRAGATFARTNGTQITETARILSIQEHISGVPHVRYNCRIHKASKVFDDGPRILALPTFLQRFEKAA